MSAAAASAPGADASLPADSRARVAIDLGAESCRVSLLQWQEGVAKLSMIHRAANGPVHMDGALRWPFERIFGALEAGLRMAAARAPEGIASIGVDGWAVDYVRLGADGRAVGDPFCYRDERTIAAKEAVDRVVDPGLLFGHTGAQPLRINTLYQLIADRAAGIDPRAPWITLPEYVLFRLGGRRVAEFTNATHTGLVDIAAGDWSRDLLSLLDLPRAAFPPIVPPGTIVGKLRGPLAELPAYRDTDLIAPACHDTASAIAGIPTPLDTTAYICSGTWSLVGTTIGHPIATAEALAAGFTNQGAAGSGFCFHTNVNGMWILKQCMESWRRQGRALHLEGLIEQSAACTDVPGIVAVDAPPLLLDGDMPALVNEQLRRAGYATIPDVPGNEPVFARVIFESLASRYAAALHDLEALLGRKMERIHVLGGGSLNGVLTRLTAERTGLPVELGSVESSTMGNFAVQMACCTATGTPLNRESIRTWAARLAGA